MTHTEIAQDSADFGEQQQFILPLNTLPDRLDKVLAKLLPEHSRARLQAWIEAGSVMVDGAPAKVRARVGPGTRIDVWPQPAPEELAFVAQEVDFAVLAESEQYIVVNKRAGLVVHPGAGNWQGTLLNGLLYRYPELAGVARAGIVHRLDKNTSGILVVARSATAQTALVRQLQARSVKRQYLALVHGHVAGPGTQSEPIGRDPKNPIRMSSINPIAPKEAITHYQPLDYGLYQGAPVSLLECRLETGRTHQIRVHLAGLGHAILGDTLYGGRNIAGAHRQMLHAWQLGFSAPHSQQARIFKAPLAPDFSAVCQQIEWEQSAYANY